MSRGFAHALDDPFSFTNLGSQANDGGCTVLTLAESGKDVSIFEMPLLRKRLSPLNPVRLCQSVKAADDG